MTEPAAPHATVDPALAVEVRPERARRSVGGRALWTRVRHDHAALSGLVFVVLLLVVCAAAPIAAPYDPLAIAPADRLAAPGSLDHPLGTDTQGRDLLSRVIWGGRATLVAALVPVVLAALMGGALGLIAGYHGRWVRLATMRSLDVFFAFPAVLLAIAIAAVLGPGVRNLVIALTIVLIPAVARVAEGAAASVRELPFVEAARASGAPSLDVILFHVLPNAAVPILVYCFSLVGPVVVFAAGLSFLGLGVQPPQPEWGSMLNALRDTLWIAPVTSMIPGIPILLTALAFDLIGNAVRDALDPRLAAR